MFTFREYPNVTNNFTIPSYDDRLTRLGMVSLHKRRVNTSMLFFYDLLSNNIHCPRLKDEVTIRENPHNLRAASVETFVIQDKVLRLADKLPLHQMCKMANKIAGNFINAESRNKFESSLRALE